MDVTEVRSIAITLNDQEVANLRTALNDWIHFSHENKGNYEVQYNFITKLYNELDD